MALTHRTLEARIAIAERGVPMPEAPRQVCLGSLSGYGILSALRVLAAGGALVFPATRDGVADAIERGRADRIALMPWSVRKLVDARTPADGPFPTLRQLEVGGERLPASLHALARERLCAEIWSVYGATESGTLAVGRLDSLDAANGEVGDAVPGIEIAAFDEAGARLPDGGVGVLRTRGPGNVASYLGDEALSRATFDDGWFATGDLGSVVGRRVSVTARVAEVFNLGGIKLAFGAIEDAARTIDSVSDVAAFAAPAENGIVHVGLAVVARAPLDAPTIRAAFVERLPGFVPNVVLAVDELPRGAGGKVRRDALGALAAARGFGAG